jgi:hypothetical protein
MSRRKALISAVFLGAVAAPSAVAAADFSCEGLVPPGQKMICSGFEPNWAVELVCGDSTMTSNFVDAFSGASIITTPGSVSFSSQNPWVFTTSTGVTGSVAYTPAGCQDESDRIHDFTFTPTAAPGLNGPFFPFCCRIE